MMRSDPEADTPLVEFGGDEWKDLPPDLRAAKDDYLRDGMGLPFRRV